MPAGLMFGEMAVKYASERSWMGPKLTTIASCVVVGLGMTVATPVGSAGTYLGARASNTQRNQPVRDAQWEARQQRQERRIQERRSAQRAGAGNPMVGPPARPAATIAVTNCDDAGPGSLRQAMLDAVPDDVIDLTALTCSTITLASGALTSSGNLELLGPGRDQLTIDGDANDRVLKHEYGILSISGVTVANGRSDNGYGGCISVYGSISLLDSTVTGCVAGDGSNTSAYGGGLDVYGSSDSGNVTLINSIVTGNSATSTADAFEDYGYTYAYGRSRGGGVYASGYVYAMNGSQVTGNAATASGGSNARGGGIFSQRGVVVFMGSEVSGNQVQALGESAYGDRGTAYGGGFHSNGSVNYVLLSTISGNTAYSERAWSYGGGINVGDDFGDQYGGVALYASTVSGNVTRSDCDDCFIQGGGVNAFGVVYAMYSTINDNSVLSRVDSGGVARGGGISVLNFYSDSGGVGSIELQNSTISGNSVIGGALEDGFGGGGGVAALYSIANIVNSTITLNTSSHGGGGVLASLVKSGSPAIYLEHRLDSSIISNNSAPQDPDVRAEDVNFYPVHFAGSHNLVTVASSSVVLPVDTINIDPQLQPLAMNGGPTATHALRESSPAIDAGSNPEGLGSDQRGVPFVREWGAAADIGAFELQPDPYPIFSDGFEDSD